MTGLAGQVQRIDARVIFETPLTDRFDAALKLLGVDPLHLASQPGHA